MQAGNDITAVAGARHDRAVSERAKQVFGVDDRVAVTLLGQKALPVGGVVGVDACRAK